MQNQQETPVSNHEQELINENYELRTQIDGLNNELETTKGIVHTLNIELSTQRSCCEKLHEYKNYLEQYHNESLLQSCDYHPPSHPHIYQQNQGHVNTNQDHYTLHDHHATPSPQKNTNCLNILVETSSIPEHVSFMDPNASPPCHGVVAEINPHNGKIQVRNLGETQIEPSITPQSSSVNVACCNQVG